MDNPEDTRFLAIFATKRSLSLLSKSDILHVDATYRLNWNRYPVMIVGVSSAQGKFFGSFAVLSSHEDTEAWKEIYSFVHRQDIHPRYRMADGAQSITKAGEEVFSDCEDCRESERLMCWSHVHRAITPQLKSLRLLNKEVANDLLSDIEEIQWSANNSTFSSLVNLLEEKYSSNVRLSAEVRQALNNFFTYFRSVWVGSKEHQWYEGAHIGSSNNQGIEGKNRDIKASHTFRSKAPLGSFCDTMLRMVHEWSLEDSSLLDGERLKILFTQPLGLKMRTAGYSWLQDNKSNKNFAEIKVTSNLKTVLPNATKIWAIPRSKSNNHDKCSISKVVIILCFYYF